MIGKKFFKAGHTPTLFAAFFYFDMAFMVWVILGPLGVQIAADVGLNAGQKGLMVAVPILAGALLRVPNGVLVDHIKPKLTGLIGQVVVLTGLLLSWFIGVSSFAGILAVGAVLGVAGASFAVALPLASQWYPPKYQGVALGIAGAGNSGTVFAALFAPGLAVRFGWINVIGLAAIPVAVALAAYVMFAEDSPNHPPPKSFSDYSAVVRSADAWWFMFFYFVTFGGFSGLGSSLSIYFNSEYGLSPVAAGYATAACVFAGSLVRPIGGALADRTGGVRALSVMYTIAGLALAIVSVGLPSDVVRTLRIHRRHDGARHGQRSHLPACASALPPRDWRHDGARRNDRWHRRLLSRLEPWLLEAIHRKLSIRAAGFRHSRCVRAHRALKHQGPLADRLGAAGGPPGCRRHGTSSDLTKVTDFTPPRSTSLTHCPYCAMQCGMAVVKQGERWIVASRDFPANRGRLCRKGWSAAELLDAPDRLTSPLIRTRKGGKLRPASWDEALDYVVTKFKSIAVRSGADAIGVFGGGGLTNEKAYMLGKFARVALRTANIDYNGRFCMASAAAAGLRAFGLDRGMPFPMEDIAKAQAIMLIGGNPVDTLPVIMQYLDAQHEAGGAFVIVDPRRSDTAKLATLHLQLTPGTDSALANGMLHVAIQHGLIDRDFIDGRTTGFEAVRRLVSSYWPDRVERMTGVPAPQIERAAHILGEAATAMLLTGRGPEQQSQGVNNVLAFINLILALGKAGKLYCGYATLTGQGNGQGGREHGQKADQLPGYRRLANPRHRAEVAAIWGVNPAELPKPGLSACELFASLGVAGGIEGLLVMGSNVVISAPGAVSLVERLANLDLLVVADPFLSETAVLADVVLPVAQWAEEEGTMTNLEGRIILRHRVKAQPEGVWTDNQVLKALADRLGYGRHFTANARETFEELRRATAGAIADYSGVTYERIDADDGVFWPCPSPDHPGTPRLFLDRFGTEDGRARFHAVDHRSPAETPDGLFPYFLTTGRVLMQYNSGTQTRRNAELREAAPEPFVEIHPETARTLGIGDGDIVTLTTRRGRAVMKARLTRDIRFDTLFVPFHWGAAGSANALTIGALDPISRIPEFKVCAVQIEKIAAPMETSLEPITPSYLNQKKDRDMRESIPKFLNGVFPFVGAGYEKPSLLSGKLTYSVPPDKRTQLIYFRAGNSSDEMVYFVMMKDGVPMRYFAVGARAGTHVPLVVVEDLFPDTKLEAFLGAPAGATGYVVIDIGLVEI